MKLHAPPRVLWRRASHRKDLGGARVAEIDRKLGLRLDQDAGPTELLQMPGLRFLLRPIGADLDKEARLRAAEKLPHKLLLAPLGQRHARSSVRSQPPLAGRHPRSADDLGRAETGHEIDKDHFAAVALDELVSHHLLAAVVATFGQDLGTHAPDQLERRILIENDDEIDRLERRQHFGPRVHLLKWPALAFQTSHRGVAVETDDESVARGAGLG